MNSDATDINAGTMAAGSASPMTADEAMDILSAAMQRAVARIMAAEAEATAVQGSQSQERTARAKRPTT